MAAFERTHAEWQDLAWLPSSLRALRWTTVGTLSAVGMGAMVLAPVVVPAHPVLMFMAGSFFIGAGYRGSGRAAASFVRRRLEKLARGEIDLARLKHEPDGELVHLSGRVRARETVPSLLEERRGVYRRLRWRTEGWTSVGKVIVPSVIHEAAVDFWLVDEQGEAILVDVTGSRWIADAEPPPQTLSEGPAFERIWALPLPPKHSRNRDRWLEQGKVRPPLMVHEILLGEGDLIDVLGYKSRVVDPTVAERMERETPTRATVKSGSQFPLLIARRE